MLPVGIAVAMVAGTKRRRLAYGRWRQRADGRKILCRHYGRAGRQVEKSGQRDGGGGSNGDGNGSSAAGPPK